MESRCEEQQEQMNVDTIPLLLFTSRLEVEKAKHKFELFEKDANEEETPGLLHLSLAASTDPR